MSIGQTSKQLKIKKSEINILAAKKVGNIPKYLIVATNQQNNRTFSALPGQTRILAQKH